MTARLLVVGAAAASVFVATVGASATTTTTTTVIPIDLVVNVPCANGGAGELVELTGTINDVFHITSDGHGGLHVKTHDNPQRVTGTGLTTGAKYQGTGVTQEEFNISPGQTDTFVDNFRMIGQGPGNNFLVHEVFHVTVNANGDVTALLDNLSTDCK